jgi:hypothetical protein
VSSDDRRERTIICVIFCFIDVYCVKQGNRGKASRTINVCVTGPKIGDVVVNINTSTILSFGDYNPSLLLLLMANLTMLRTLYNTIIKLVDRVKDYILRIKELPSDEDRDDPLTSSIPESARKFFASVSSPTEILSSNLISRVQVIEGRYNYVHILNFNARESEGLFSFVLRFPIDPNAISRWQTSTSVGCMLYCQRHPNLNIPTPAIYAYSCTYWIRIYSHGVYQGRYFERSVAESPSGRKREHGLPSCRDNVYNEDKSGL